MTPGRAFQRTFQPNCAFQIPKNSWKVPRRPGAGQEVILGLADGPNWIFPLAYHNYPLRKGAFYLSPCLVSPFPTLHSSHFSISFCTTWLYICNVLIGNGNDLSVRKGRLVACSSNGASLTLVETIEFWMNNGDKRHWVIHMHLRTKSSSKIIIKLR